MKQFLLLCIGWVFGMVAANAQAEQTAKKEKKRHCSCAFSAINQVGFTEGSKNSAFLFQSINGIRYKRWFAGIGAGLDYYHVRGIPLFLDIRRDILARANSPFIYVDGGMQFTWERSVNKYAYGGKTEFDNGWYYDLGVGYKLQGKDNNALLLSAGFSFKQLKETRTNIGYCQIPPCPVYTDIYDYKLNRLSVKLGWQL
jgi:hypothetical protein